MPNKEDKKITEKVDETKGRLRSIRRKMAIRREQMMDRVEIEEINTCLDTLVDIMTDPDVPPASRIKAAEVMLGYGLGKPTSMSDPEKAVQEPSPSGSGMNANQFVFHVQPNAITEQRKAVANESDLAVMLEARADREQPVCEVSVRPEDAEVQEDNEQEPEEAEREDAG